MADLFSSAPQAPLAEILRPQSLDDVVGQAHLVGPGMPLRLAFEARQLHSFVLWGPPGVGKTTIARLAAYAMECEFTALSAVMAGVKEIRDAVERAQTVLDHHGRRTVLFIDEVHRLNKAQQDALLPFVESGLLCFIGATTANPSMEVNAALLSRARVYVLKSLTEDDLRLLVAKACRSLGGLVLEDAAIQAAIGLADGDARRLLGLLEQLDVAARAAKLTRVTAEFVGTTAGTSLRRFDKGEDAHYEQISALHKSVRGSSPEGALYWLTRMLDAGADARYIARRLVRMASEEIGNADPRALRIALDAAEAYERLGSPEGELALAQAAVYLAVAPKSNAVYVAFNEMRALVQADSSRAVPMHLRNAPTKLMQSLGYKEGYRYAHDEPDAYAAGETYLPDGVPAGPRYRPVPRGLELKIGEKLDRLREADAAATAQGLGRTTRR